jgi:hypothetical protein
MVRHWLQASPVVQRTGRYTFTVGGRNVDFAPITALPPTPRSLDALVGTILGLLGNQTWILKMWHWFLRHG